MVRDDRSGCGIRSRRAAEAVALMQAGVRPGPAAHTVGAQPRQRVSLVGALPGGGLGGAAGAPLHGRTGSRGGSSAAAEATILAARERRGAGPLMLGGPARAARLDHRQGAAAAGAFAPSTPAAGRRSDAYERAPPGEAAAPGHQEAGPLLAYRQAHPPRRHPAQPAGRLATRARRHRRPFTGWPTPRLRSTDRQEDAVAFLDRALTWFRTQGIAVQAVMTDNGSGLSLARVATALRCACPAPPAPPRPLHAPHQTARRNASSKSCCAVGRTPSPTRPASTAHRALGGWLRWYNPSAPPRLPRWPATRQPCLTPLWSVQLGQYRERDSGGFQLVGSWWRNQVRWRRAYWRVRMVVRWMASGRVM